jgi:hydroxyacid-oxoacid transhydrogenase
MAASTLRFGTGVTREVGMDVTNMLARLPAAERANSKIAVFTDPNITKLPVMKTVEQALQKEGHKFAVFDKVAVEPTEASWTEAIEWTRANNITHFLAVGGGSTMDTAKAANLLSCYPDKDMYEFINAPVGKGTPIDKALKPLIAGEL